MPISWPRKAGVLALLLAVGLLNSWWFAGAGPVSSESPLRMVMGAIFLFVVPGLIWGEICGFRARHPWEMIAQAFSITIFIELLLLPIPFILHAPIELWIGLLLAVTAVGLGVLAVSVRRDRTWHFLTPLLRLPRGSWLSWCVLGIPVAMAVGSYAAGEELFHIAGEKILHLMFVRYYHDMPLSLQELGVHPGMAPPNLVNLWEFLLAAWSRLIHVDPLIVFFRARCVIPVLGLAGLYLLLRTIFVRRSKVELIFFGITLMCLCNFVLLSPAFSVLQIGDITRGVFAFMGTVHHADPAVDILLALSAGLVLRLVRRPSLRHACLLVAIMAANFLWHPREFLQLALYVGVLGITLIAFPAWRPALALRNWALAVVLLVASAGAFLVLSTRLVAKESHGYDEVGIKRTALEYAVMPANLMRVRNFFNFPYHCMLSSTIAPEKILTFEELNTTYIRPNWQLDHWLILSALGLVLLGVFGNRADRGLAAFYFWLWLLALVWNFSMFVILALTYSEFFMVTPRLLFLFAYIVIADALIVVPNALARMVWQRGWLERATARVSPAMLLSLALLAGGVGFWAWQHFGSPGAKMLSWPLTILMWAVVPWMFIQRRAKARADRSAPFAVGGLTLLLFFAPFLAARGTQLVLKKQYRNMVRSQPAWFDNENPCGMSADLIAWLRTLPAGRNILVYPYRPNYVHAYAPHYETIFPMTPLLIDLPVLHEIEDGKHPLLVKPALPGEPSYAQFSNFRVDDAKAKGWLKQKRVEFLLINHDYYESYLHDYVRLNLQHFVVAFDNPEQRELVVRFVSDP